MSDTIQRLFREDLDKARMEAFKEGFKEGYRESFRESFREGRQQIASLTARNLLELKMSHDKIAQITGLSLAEVEKLAVTS